jgi:hypothetical protein
MKKYRYRVVGDYSRTTYSRHKSLEAAIKAARKLWRLWKGTNQPGAEPAIVDNEAMEGKEIEVPCPY